MWMAALLVFGLGCGPAEQFASWPANELDLRFLLRASGTGNVEVHGPFRSSELSTATPIRFELDEGETLFELAVSSEALEALHPRIDLGGPGGPSLEVEAAECETGVFEEDRALRLPVASLPFATRSLSDQGTWVESTLPPAISANLSLRLPYVEARACPGTKWRLELFASERLVIADGTIIEGAPRFRSSEGDVYRFFNWNNIVFIDERHLVAATVSHLFFLERGQSFDPRRVQVLSSPLPSRPGVEVRLHDLVRDPRSEGSDRVRLLAVFGSSGPTDNNPAPRGAVQALYFDASGLAEVGTATPTTHSLDRVAIAEDGRFVLAGEFGFVATGHVDRGIEETFILREQDPAADDVLLNPNPEAPFVVVSDASRVFSVRPGQGLQGSRLLGPEALVTSSANVIWAKPNAAPEIWMSTFTLGIRRLVGETWSDVSVIVPSAAEACTATQRRCGERHFNQPARSMVQLADGRLLLGPMRCSALVIMSPDSSCADIVSFPGDSVQIQTQSSFSKLDRYGELVALTGNDGELVVLTP